MKEKFWYGGLLVLLVLALTVFFSACSGAGVQPTQAGGGIVAPVQGGGELYYSGGSFTEGLVVVGTGVASAEPEVAQVIFGVDLRGDDPAALVDEGAQKIDKAIAAAKGMGVTDGDIRTVGYSLWVETLYDPETGMSTDEVVYHLSHQVEVTLRDLDKVGDLLAAVVGAGVNSVSGVTFAVEEPEALVEQARQLALQDAAAKAQKMADDLGITLGKPILVMETGGGYPAMMDRGVGGGGMVEAPSISPGTFSISVSVQIVYQIP